MLRYLKLGGICLEPYINELKPYLTSVQDIVDSTGFYERLKKEFLEKNEHRLVTLSGEQEDFIAEKHQAYCNIGYIKGDINFPSKGNCDVISGSGKEAKLKIKSLEGKVKFS